MWRYLRGFRHIALPFSYNTAKQRVENLENSIFSAQLRMENSGVALLCPLCRNNFLKLTKILLH